MRACGASSILIMRSLGCDERLGDIAATSDLRPHAFRHLVAAIDGLAAMAAGRLEKQLLARLPQGIGVVGSDQDRAGNAGKLGTGLGATPPSFERRLVGEECKVALVREKGVVMRVRRHDHRAVPIGLAQRRVVRPIEREIGGSIVDEVDILPVYRKSASRIAKTARVGDDRIDAALGQNPLRQHELGVEILSVRAIVDDGDPLRSAGSPLSPPLVHEHAEGIVLEAAPLRRQGRFRSRRSTRAVPAKGGR